MSKPLHPDKRRARIAFARAAVHYDEHAILQREVGARLLERLTLFHHAPRVILDVGCGTGWLGAKLANHYRGARLVNIDLAHAMVSRARGCFSPLWWRFRGHNFVCGDAEQLPFADASFDMLFSNLTLQWCSDLATTFSEFRRVLKPRGLLLFSTLGPDTLKELRAAWAAVDDQEHVNTFVDMHDVGDAMIRNRLADPVMDREDLVMTYRDSATLLRDLKGIGTHNTNPGRTNGLTGRRKIEALFSAYEQCRAEDGRLPATYEILYGHAWRAGEEYLPQPPGEVRVALDTIRRS